MMCVAQNYCYAKAKKLLDEPAVIKISLKLRFFRFLWKNYGTAQNAVPSKRHPDCVNASTTAVSVVNR